MRYSPRTTTTNQPTNRAPNEPARPMRAQESIFWGKMAGFGPIILIILGAKVLVPTYQKTYFALFFLFGHGTKWTRMANIWPKMTKNAYFRPNLALFGPKILIFTGESMKLYNWPYENVHFVIDTESSKNTWPIGAFMNSTKSVNIHYPGLRESFL